MVIPDWQSLARIRQARARRASSWDTTGGNADCVKIEPGETAVLADISGPGVITHIYATMIEPDPMDYRDAVLRVFWDGEEQPSVEVPFGDFFCISNCTVRRFASLMMTVNPGMGNHTINNGVNCYFPMPFSTGARIELVNQSDRVFGGHLGRLWYHIDYLECDEAGGDDVGRFHAQWRRENPTETADVPRGEGKFPGLNLTGKDNYTLLEAEGEGHLAGILLQIDNIQGGWYGEGDDMIFIDGDTWPPSLHGTGTEEVFGGGACPDKEYAGPYTGFHLIENRDGVAFSGKNAMYRWYVRDPVCFRKSIRVTIEHGHANDFANDYSSVAYWYQREPHAPFPKLPPLEDRRPRMPEGFHKAHAGSARLTALLVPVLERIYLMGLGSLDEPWLQKALEQRNRAFEYLQTSQFEEAIRLYEEAIAIADENLEHTR